MNRLFEEYKNTGRLSEALLIGNNALNRDPGSEAVFSPYFAFLCDLAERLPSFEDRMRFAERASVALSFYSENADINETTISTILESQARVDSICQALNQQQFDRNQSEQEEINRINSDALKNLYTLKGKLQAALAQEEFDDVLAQIGQVDSKIVKDVLTDEQNDIYNSLTKELTERISSKMRELEQKKNIAYNQQAADAFAKAFKEFRADESQYKKQTQLFKLVSQTLFAFDASRLFNETLIYYNHVYSYIFSKLDDDGKLALTRYSIECERKLR